MLYDNKNKNNNNNDNDNDNNVISDNCTVIWDTFKLSFLPSFMFQFLVLRF